MNEIYQINDWLVKEFQKNELVNTISTLPTLQIDTQIANIYPLVNLDLQDTDITESQISANYRITIVQQRDTRTDITDNKLLTNSNYIDNVSETHSIAHKLLNKLLRGYNDLNIEIQSQSTLRQLKNWSRNSLDGVQFDLELAIPNAGTIC
ncbi:hypothetical protein [Flavobacterium nitrogenifigens]|uniref:Uncharacterized protein n=1 Tax=Flavobacterium nitrogenifigens TaxID=1617283 RepID=A0A521AE15_9FLAO|nr:hypothetical protein [Flavobacterium nitrogenifigens]KAF2331459.1 hypothetical protein DM397_12030 [Flavobacterium nitrogenifigens]SMO33052.1 hypothetical protein SAMN06265220_10153 [Flavobacterium nitrogenifigens]